MSDKPLILAIRCVRTSHIIIKSNRTGMMTMMRQRRYLPFFLALQYKCMPFASTFENFARNIVAGEYKRKMTSSFNDVANKVIIPDTNTSDDNNMSSDTYQLFGRFRISSDQIFHRTSHSFALVNLRPIVPGHVLVCSNRVTPSLADLEDDEYDDLWRAVRTVQKVLQNQYKCDAFNVAVQDGVGAGQSVPHVHVHILPRCIGDFQRNDDIYDQLEAWAPKDDNNIMSRDKPKLDVPEDSERRDRTVEEMAEEAAMYKRIICGLSI